MTSRILALLVAVGILAVAAPLGAGQAQDGPQFRVRIETANLDALRQNLEDAGYDVLGTDPDKSTLDVAVSRAELNGLYARGLSILSVERGRPLEPRRADRAASAESELSVTAAAVSAGYLNLDGIVARLNPSPRPIPLSRRSSTSRPPTTRRRPSKDATSTR